MQVPQSTWDWIRERDRAYKRREYIRRLSRDARRLDQTLPSGYRADELWQRLLADLSNFGDAIPER